MAASSAFKNHQSFHLFVHQSAVDEQRCVLSAAGGTIRTSSSSSSSSVSSRACLLHRAKGPPTIRVFGIGGAGGTQLPLVVVAVVVVVLLLLP